MGNTDLEQKPFRLLTLCERLRKGAVVSKADAAQEFHITPRSVQRDMEDLRCFFAEQNPRKQIIYDAKARGYRLADVASEMLSKGEVLAVCKILLESRSLVRAEMIPILDKLISCCVPEQDKRTVADIVSNEKFHYIEPHHGQEILDGLWAISQAIRKHQVMEITYERLKDPKLVIRRVEPVGIMFSEYYFYLTAFLREVDREKEFENKDDCFPTIYRIDRIKEIRVLDDHFQIPYKDRFQEGEFRKRVQFMFGGKLQTVKFKYTGPSIEAVLDRLPTAEIVEQDGEGWIIRAEVFGKGIEMWLRSQGEYIVL